MRGTLEPVLALDLAAFVVWFALALFLHVDDYRLMSGLDFCARLTLTRFLHVPDDRLWDRLSSDWLVSLRSLLLLARVHFRLPADLKLLHAFAQDDFEDPAVHVLGSVLVEVEVNSDVLSAGSLLDERLLQDIEHQ